MSVTREEAAHILEYSRIVSENFTQEAVTATYVMALAALRGPTREQVEKVFPGCRSCKSCRSCVFSINNLKDMPCKKCDPNAEYVLTEYKPSNFCPVCGKPLTDEAVQMVLERLKGMKDGTD